MEILYLCKSHSRLIECPIPVLLLYMLARRQSHELSGYVWLAEAHDFVRTRTIVHTVHICTCMCTVHVVCIFKCRGVRNGLPDPGVDCHGKMGIPKIGDPDPHNPVIMDIRIPVFPGKYAPRVPVFLGLWGSLREIGDP